MPTTNPTQQVTAPGVRVHTNEGTGDMEVDAWGFHLVCRKDSKTGKTRCRTRNEWWCVCCVLCDGIVLRDRFVIPNTNTRYPIF